MTPTFDSSLAFVIIFWWFMVVLFAYTIIKLPGFIKKYINGPDSHSVIKPNHSIKKSILIGIIAGFAPVLVLVALILTN